MKIKKIDAVTTIPHNHIGIPMIMKNIILNLTKMEIKIVTDMTTFKKIIITISMNINILINRSMLMAITITILIAITTKKYTQVASTLIKPKSIKANNLHPSNLFHVISTKNIPMIIKIVIQKVTKKYAKNTQYKNKSLSKHQQAALN
jgi:hypothetical protein